MIILTVHTTVGRIAAAWGRAFYSPPQDTAIIRGDVPAPPRGTDGAAARHEGPPRLTWRDILRATWVMPAPPDSLARDDELRPIQNPRLVLLDRLAHPLLFTSW